MLAFLSVDQIGKDESINFKSVMLRWKFRMNFQKNKQKQNKNKRSNSSLTTVMNEHLQTWLLCLVILVVIFLHWFPPTKEGEKRQKQLKLFGQAQPFCQSHFINEVFIVIKTEKNQSGRISSYVRGYRRHATPFFVEIKENVNNRKNNNNNNNNAKQRSDGIIGLMGWMFVGGWHQKLAFLSK